MFFLMATLLAASQIVLETPGLDGSPLVLTQAHIEDRVLDLGGLYSDMPVMTLSSST
ncbi:hypothetical protein T492DRAFT_937593, partial [Pavlovales sp. CCMP2436]